MALFYKKMTRMPSPSFQLTLHPCYFATSLPPAAVNAQQRAAFAQGGDKIMVATQQQRQARPVQAHHQLTVL